MKIIGQITGFQTGFRNGETVAEFIDQDGNYLTHVPRRELGLCMALDGTGRFYVAAINGVPVWPFLVDAPPTQLIDAALK